MEFSQQGPTITETVFAQTTVTRIFEPTRTVTAWAIVTETCSSIISPGAIAQPATSGVLGYWYDGLAFISVLGYIFGLLTIVLVLCCRQQPEPERDDHRGQPPSRGEEEPSNAEILERLDGVLKGLGQPRERVTAGQRCYHNNVRPANAVRRRDREGNAASTNDAAPAKDEPSANDEPPASEEPLTHSGATANGETAMDDNVLPNQALQSRLNTTSQPQSESFEALTSVTSRPGAQQKALTDKAEARHKALGKAEGQDDALTTKKGRDDDDETEQTEEETRTMLSKIRPRNPMVKLGTEGDDGAPVAESTTQKLAAPVMEIESSARPLAPVAASTSEEEKRAKKHKRVANPIPAQETVASIPASVSAIPPQPATTTNPPAQFSENNPLRKIHNHDRIMKGMHGYLVSAAGQLRDLGSIDIRINADKQNSKTQLALDKTEQNAEWLQIKEQQNELSTIKPWTISDDAVRGAYEEAHGVMQILEAVGKDEGFEPDDLLLKTVRSKNKDRSGWRTYADCQTIRRTLAIVLEEEGQ